MKKMVPLAQRTILLVFFTAAAIALATAIGVTCSSYPLFNFSVDNLEWTKNWLIATVIDYYGAATCLCVIALLSEPMLQGLAWSTGFLLLGSPICCLYCIYRLLYKSLALNNHTYSAMDTAHVQGMNGNVPLSSLYTGSSSSL